MRQFITKAEENLNPALDELRQTLQDVRKVTADISHLTDKLRAAAGAIVTVEKSIQNLYGYYREGFGQATNANMAALKAGVGPGW